MTTPFVPVAPAFPLAGEAACLGAALIWSCSMSLFSRFGGAIPGQALNLYKNLVAYACMVLTAVVLRPPLPDDWSALPLLALSGVVGISLGDTALFGALKRLGAQITSASQCLAPPISALVAALALGETLTPRELAGLFVTVTAVAAILYFGHRGRSRAEGASRKNLAVGILLAVLSAACQGTAIVISRQAIQHVHVLYGTLARITPALLVLFTFSAVGPGKARLRVVWQRGPRQGLMISLAAFGGTFLGLLLMMLGAKYAKAGVAAALTSTYPIWIIPLARLWLKEPSNWQSVVCTVFAVAGIVLMVA